MATALFSYPSSEEGFLFFVYIVGYQSMVMTGFVRRVCVCTWQGGRNLNGYTSLLLWNYFYLYFTSSFSCVFAFLSVLHGEMDIDIWSSASYKKHTKSWHSFLHSYLLSCYLEQQSIRKGWEQLMVLKTIGMSTAIVYK